MIIDLVLILLFIVCIFIGYKVGFLKSIIKVASSLCGVIFALLFFGSLADMLIDLGWGTYIKDKVYNNIITSEAMQNIDLTAKDSLEKLITELGIPNFLSNVLANSIANSIDANEIALTLSEILSNIALNIIAFFILLFGSSILFLLLKLLVCILRTSTFVKILDGLLGVIFASIVYFIAIYIVFFILYLVIDIPSVNNAIGPFITDQMHLNDENSFSIGRYFYKDNIITNLFKLFF